MDTEGSLFIPLFGLNGVSPRGGRLSSLPGSTLGFLFLLDFGVMVRLVGLVLGLQLRMFGAGLFQWTFWLSSVLLDLRLLRIFALVASPMLSFFPV